MEGASVDISAVRRVMALAAPAFEVREVRFFDEGWDNTVFLVNQDLVVRIAKRTGDSERLLAEVRTLESIGPLLSLPVPRPEFSHRPSAGFPLAATAYRLIPGTPLTAQLLTADNVDPLARDLATFLDRLHAVPVEVVSQLAIPRYTPAGWLQHHDDLVHRAASDLRQYLEREQYIRFSAWWDEYRASPGAEAFEPTFVHGDLGGQHILIESNPWRVSGVIDFGDAMLADPALDLAGIPDRLARSVISKMCGDHGSDALRRRRHAYRLLAPLHAVLAGRERGDASLLAEGIDGLRDRLTA